MLMGFCSVPRVQFKTFCFNTPQKTMEYQVHNNTGECMKRDGKDNVAENDLVSTFIAQ